jgi:hypothetical protein
MAQYIRGRGVASRIPTEMTLKQVEDRALANGCTLAQFNFATETIGIDPQFIVPFLIRRGFVGKAFIAEFSSVKIMTRKEGAADEQPA